ncbi:hypothetical protein EVAR_7937_1 [Eumeta japonica]|uniref:Uncharacterized protein n=1 Tax=Eumeta variegata TaxID=151549 RepID=A0A4C1TVN2_EUMVA|nr:hypothetical protein EVAR_7937_1 [Eumeta japonica]
MLQPTRLLYESGSALYVSYRTLIDYTREITASTVVLRTVTPSPSIAYSIPAQEVGTALTTLVELRVSMGGGVTTCPLVTLIRGRFFDSDPTPAARCKNLHKSERAPKLTRASESSRFELEPGAAHASAGRISCTADYDKLGVEL